MVVFALALLIVWKIYDLKLVCQYPNYFILKLIGEKGGKKERRKEGRRKEGKK